MIPRRRPLHTLLLATALLPATVLALEPGDQAPPITLPGLRAADGASVTLDDYRGKVVYVDFWASWCPPCLVSIPLINDLRNRLVAEGAPFEVLAVNVDVDPDDGREFLDGTPVDYVAVSDPEGDTPAAYELKGMPSSFLLDAGGRIHLVHTGFRRSDMDMIEAAVRTLLDALP